MSAHAKKTKKQPPKFIANRIRVLITQGLGNHGYMSLVLYYHRASGLDGDANKAGNGKKAKIKCLIIELMVCLTMIL